MNCVCSGDMVSKFVELTTIAHKESYLRQALRIQMDANRLYLKHGGQDTMWDYQSKKSKGSNVICLMHV